MIVRCIPMKKMFSSMAYRIGTAAAAMALMFTVRNVNTTCVWLAHQPKLPQGADKLKKHQ